MKKLCLVLLFVCFLLSGCGTYYAVSVDSLSDSAPPSGPNCVLVSGTEGISENDLAFKELARMVAPALRANGYEVILNRDAAQNLVKLSWWQEEPRTITETSYVTNAHPIIVGRGRYRYVDYIYVDEPVVTTYTIYTINLHIEAWELDKGKETGRQVWRTTLRSSGTSNDFRTRLFSMAQVLPRVIGSHSNGLQRYDVFLGNDGKVEVEHLGAGGI